MNNFKRVLTGLQPTNDLTIGNYFGALLPLLNIPNNYELFLFVADLHSITLGEFERNNLNKNKINLVKSFIAMGFDKKEHINIFYQSSILENANLFFILSCLSSIGELNRMTQFKDKSSKLANQQNGTNKIPTGLLVYPVLMAADIIIMNAHLVVVGADQKQHLELTKILVERLNKIVGASKFNIPEPFIPKIGAKICDLTNPSIKMSKSNTNTKGTIFLNDPIEISIKKIRSAVTDNYNCVKYDVENQPGISNLINIYSLLTNKEIKDIEQEFKNIANYGVFKEKIAEALTIFLTNFQSKFNTISNEDIHNFLLKGTNKAKEIASKNLKLIFNKIGFNNEQ